jgi:hypothetical protein
VRLSTEERQALSALRRYGAAVLGENPSAAIALSVLDKRAFSSPWSLAQSVDRRLAVLDATGSSADEAQMALPLGDPDGDCLVEDAPPAWPSDLELRDRQRDRRLLRAVLEASRAAVGRERKIASLRRLLRRTEEPAIVFTEYRDTLVHLQRALGGVPTVVIHGGMTQPERAAAITAFERGRRAVLLATDAAGEGLNLQRHCRLVVNLELPWNPVRLEQRIGRVDRIGQTRTVHAVHLVAAGTGELRILERLHARVARAQAAIGAADPVGGRDAFAPWPTGGGAIEFPDFHGAAPAEADRLQRSRSWSAGANRGGSKVEPRVPAIVRTSRTGLRSVLGSRALLVWRVAIVSNSGPALESTIAGVTLQGLTAARTPSDQTRTVRQLTDRISAAVGQSSCGWREAAMRVLAAFVRTRLTRERAILAALSGSAPGEFQPGLFDGRAVRAQEQALLRVKDASQHVVDRIASVERLADVTVLPPVLLLAVVP